jgi:hypothetical protein
MIVNATRECRLLKSIQAASRRKCMIWLENFPELGSHYYGKLDMGMILMN